jgi:uncharacterized protein YnzC (UPF0291/DUF896 family)
MSVPDDVLKAIDEIDIEGCREQLKFALESLDIAREMMETRITNINKVVDRTGNDKKKKSIAELPAYKDSRVEH